MLKYDVWFQGRYLGNMTLEEIMVCGKRLWDTTPAGTADLLWVELRDFSSEEPFQPSALFLSWFAAGSTLP